ncbi:MAG: HAD-IA family hydrolase [Acidobacteriota bacterium]
MRKIEVPEFIKGLIFDCDGTLVDSMPFHMNAWEHAIRFMGQTWHSDFFVSRKGMPEESIVVQFNEQFSANLDPVHTVQVKHDYFRQHAARFKPIPSVLSIARKYAGVLPMAVASGGVRENVMLELETLSIRSLFQAILTADDDIRPKPAPDIFLEAAKRIGVPPEYCQVFEDGNLGLQAAREAGMLPTDVRKYVK